MMELHPQCGMECGELNVAICRGPWRPRRRWRCGCCWGRTVEGTSSWWKPLQLHSSLCCLFWCADLMYCRGSWHSPFTWVLIETAAVQRTSFVRVVESMMVALRFLLMMSSVGVRHNSCKQQHPPDRRSCLNDSLRSRCVPGRLGGRLVPVGRQSVSMLYPVIGCIQVDPGRTSQLLFACGVCFHGIPIAQTGWARDGCRWHIIGPVSAGSDGI